MTETSVGIVGCGYIGTVHLQSARALDGVRPVAVADAAADNRERARDLGVSRVYEDYESLLTEESLDVAVVALPPFLHEEAAVAAVRAGCDVFVEKPFARSTEEARRILRAADRYGASVGVDHSTRYQPDVRRLEEEFETGSIGRVPMCTVSKFNDNPFSPPPVTEDVTEWKLDPSLSGGGALMDLGVHLYDVLEWLFGDLRVEGVSLSRQMELPYEDAATVTLRAVETGTIATLNCGFFQWQTPPDVNTYLRLEGVAGTLDSREYTPDNFAAYSAKSALENVWKRLRGREPDHFGPAYYYRAHYRAFEAFLDAVRAGRTPPVDGETGLRTLEFVEACYAEGEAADDLTPAFADDPA